jgi:tRNA (adenine-N(1)-)-methyltransferase non-catalytic subunit
LGKEDDPIKDKKQYYNSVIIVHEDYHPGEIITAVNDLIQPSACIVIFSTFLHPLAECREQLLQSKSCLFTRIEELWTREYQVLPMRTHPHMSMHGASGFVLSCVKVL